jgi:glycine betaine/proline transport system substrate-binding protein
MTRSRTTFMVCLISITLAASACAEATPAAPLAPGQGIEIQMARANWSTGYFQAAVASMMLEELGYTVADPTNNEAGPPDFYSGLASGEYHLWVNGWFPNHDVFLAEALPEGGTVGSEVTVVGSVVVSGAFQGFLTDIATADEYDIQHFEDIAENPAVAAMYDTNGDGTADITGCDEGWGCHTIINEMITANGWEATLSQNAGDFAVLFAETVSSYEAGEPVLTYVWAPSGYIAQLVPGDDVIWLGFRDPQAVGPQVIPFPPQQCPGQPCDLGLQRNSVGAVVNNEFLAANPAVAALFEVFSLPMADIAVQNLRMLLGEDSEAEIRLEAGEWIASNRIVVDSWLTYAREAAEG